MLISGSRLLRNLILALLLGAALVPLAPDTSKVAAETQHASRISTAHAIAAQN